eukprot:6948623-Alexandrium_andersonii.AAC.1
MPGTMPIAPLAVAPLLGPPARPPAPGLCEAEHFPIHSGHSGSDADEVRTPDKTRKPPRKSRKFEANE